MSVYIKGMEMPSKCGICPCLGTDDQDIPYYCRLDYDIEGVSFKSKPKDCPLIEVPEHGRLIDADALYKDGWVLQKQVMRMGGYAIHEMPLTCPSLPIIIPADKESVE